MTTTSRAAALVAGAAALALPLVSALPAEAATPTTITILTTKAKLEGGTAYRIDDHGGKKLIEGAHFELNGSITCDVVAGVSTQGFVDIYVDGRPLNGRLGNVWLPCNSNFSFDVPGVKGKTTVTARVTARYGAATTSQEVHLIAPAVGPTS